MPHVDEGTLHALLDGALKAEDPARAAAVEAHLAVCTDCAARLEDATAVKARAGDVLAALQPAAVRPDFEEVLVRSGRRDTASQPGVPVTAARRRLRRTRRLAWAASLVVALGTGYLIGQEFALGPAGDGAPTTFERAGADEPAADDAPAAEREERARPVTPVSPGTSAPPAPAAPTDGVPTASTEQDQAETEAPDQIQGRSVARLRPRAGSSETVGGGEPAGRAVRMESEALAPQAMESDAGVVEDLRISPTAGEAGWRTIEAGDAAVLLQGPVLRLPEAKVRSLEARSVDGAVSVRSTQELPEGVAAVVTQTRVVPPPDARAAAAARLLSGAEAEAAPPLAPGEQARAVRSGAADRLLDRPDVRTVVVERESYLLTVSGTLPRDVLIRLAEAATPTPAP